MCALQVLYAMQSSEQGVAVLVWQSKIIVLFMLVSPCLLLLACAERWNGHAPINIMGKENTPERFFS